MSTRISVETSSQKLNEMHLTLIDGLIGFEHLTKYKLTRYQENTPFYWFISLEEPELKFILTEPQYIIENYVVDLTEQDILELEIEDTKDIFVLVILCIPDNPRDMTANLLGPLVFNSKNNKGKQIVLHNSNYPVQYKIFPEGLKDED